MLLHRRALLHLGVLLREGALLNIALLCVPLIKLRMLRRLHRPFPIRRNVRRLRLLILMVLLHLLGKSERGGQQGQRERCRRRRGEKAFHLKNPGLLGSAGLQNIGDDAAVDPDQHILAAIMRGGRRRWSLRQSTWFRSP
jgi:hypothetical protein